jgi:hypothetical protein
VKLIPLEDVTHFYLCNWIGINSWHKVGDGSNEGKGRNGLAKS